MTAASAPGSCSPISISSASPTAWCLSDRGLDQGTIEYKRRHEAEARDVPIDQVVALMRGSVTVLFRASCAMIWASGSRSPPCRSWRPEGPVS